MDLRAYAFFHRATTEICRHLKAEEALRACAALLQEYMPVESMFLEVWDSELGAVRAIAWATPQRGEVLDRLVPMSSQQQVEVIQKVRGQSPEDNVFILNEPEKDPVARSMLEGLNRGTDMSVIGTYPMMDNQVVGSVVALVSGSGRYLQEHADLFALLKSPFAITIQNALRYREVEQLSEWLADDNRYLQQELRGGPDARIIGGDFGLAEVMRAARQVAVHDSPVLLLGETGVGKDVLANYIHEQSPRGKGPFIKVNCGAIPEALMDSELFGHEKGAFTGALSQKRGRFERAHKGTIFLDEIGELRPEAQTRLLRVLQHKEIERVGGDRTIQVDLRIIAATHRNLASMVKDGSFREDLWFRINVFPLEIPPLRARRNDIPALVQHFLTQKAGALKFTQVPRLTREDLAVLVAYAWPGNVRELENVIERALILGGGDGLVLDRLMTASQNEPETLVGTGPFKTLDQAMADHIREALRHTEGKVHGADGAAAMLGINAGTLRSRMKKLGIAFGRQRES